MKRPRDLLGTHAVLCATLLLAACGEQTATLQRDARTGSDQTLDLNTARDARVSDALIADGVTADGGSQGDGATLKATGAVCKTAGECQTGYCTDGVCCGSAACPACESCAISGKEGACHDMAAVCAPFLCDIKTSQCLDSCTFDKGCVQDSVCDRSQAHATGKGICVAPAQVVTVTSTIQKAINTATPTQTHFKLTDSRYDETIDIPTDRTVNLIAARSTMAAISAKQGSAGVPPLRLSDGAIVSLQNITLRDAHDVAGFGLHCLALKTPGQISLIESAVSDNSATGILANGCHLTVRRTRIERNDGGIDFDGGNIGGRLVVTNSIIAENGRCVGLITPLGCSAVAGTGGVYINSAAAVDFAHNTVANNFAERGFSGSAKVASGLICANQSVTIYNTIVEKNHTVHNQSNVEQVAQAFGCSITPAVASGNCELNSAYQLVPPSPLCVDGGTSLASTKIQLLLDIANGPRDKGTPPDLGPHELK
ncbi:MAG: hypothetical protein H6707_09670 [Deltaproteobacteria bacterium]|nr:hypothetical protein [Deltaproteobacteria bacterium]